MVSILTTAARVSAVIVLRELASSFDVQCLDAMSTTSGMHDALVNLLEKPVSPQATKAALVMAYYLVTNNTTDCGCLPLRRARHGAALMELLVDAGKDTTEKALAVLDSLLLGHEKEGRVI
jgi:hypothetical protein